MNEIQVIRTIDDVTREIIDLQDQTRRLVLGYAIEVGRRLVEAKDMLPHGEWGAWLAEKVNFKQRTAQRLMTLYEEYGAEQIGIFGAEIKASALTNLSFTNALLLVAVPEEEREEFAAEVDAEHISSRDLQEAIRQRDEALIKVEEAEAAKKAAEDEADKLDEERATLDEELRELKNRPIEYAVQEPDPKAVKIEVDKALAAADVEHMKKMDALNKKLEGLEKKRDKLEKDLKASEDAKTAAEKAAADKGTEASKTISIETARLEQEISHLKKELAMADAGVTAFKTIFNESQIVLGKLLEYLSAVEDPEAKEKLRAGAVAMLKMFGDKAKEA